MKGGAQRGDAASQWDAALKGAAGARSLSSFLSKSSLPDRLASLILDVAGVPDVQLSYLSRDARARVVETLTAFPLPATGTEGYRTAEVTGGGVALEEVDPGSGRSRLVPGLFLAGEILGRLRPDRRLQLPVGVGDRPHRRRGGRARLIRASARPTISRDEPWAFPGRRARSGRRR